MTEVFDNSDEMSKEVLEPELLVETQPKVDQSEAGCSRPKRGRRGKKRRNKSQDNEGFKFNDESNSKRGERNSKSGESKKRSKLLIRPTNVPKAPENSTQFIIDDHDECHLYFSFETPNPYKEQVRNDSSDIFNDAALQDIDYEYESMQDLDNTAYYLQDFELSYSKVRYEETMRLTKPDLVTALENLESRVRELEHKMYEKDPGSALEQLQRSLLRLQEENIALREEQQHLRKTVIGEESGSDDMLPDSESEHSHNFDNDEHDMNDLSFESSDAFSGSENEDHVGFSDLSNEQSSDNEVERDNSDNDESVSSVIYGLPQDYDNHPDENSSEYEIQSNQDSFDDPEMQYVNEQSQNSMYDGQSDEAIDLPLDKSTSSDYLQESSNDSLLKIKANGIDCLENNEKLNSNDGEQSQELSNSEQLQDKPIVQIQELINVEQCHKNFSLEQLQNSRNNQELQETSNFELTDSNKPVQNQRSKQLDCDISNEQNIAENCQALQECIISEQLINVNSEQLQEINCKHLQDVNSVHLQDITSEHLEDAKSEHLCNKHKEISNE